MSPSAPAPSLPLAKDFSAFLSLEASTRKKSPLKGLLRFMNGDMISLGGGLPHPSTFPFLSLSADVRSMAPATTAKKGSSQEVVTVPHTPTPGKIESLSSSLQYGLGTGIRTLREFCKEHIASMHHPQYQDWNVVLSAGNTDAYSKAISLLCDRGDTILVEEWTYPTALETLEPLGINYAPVTMDQEGMSAVALKTVLDNWGSNPDQATETKPRVVYLIPTGQNPTGTTMSVQRRHDIMRVAQEHNLILIEDDPYYYLQFSAGDNQSEGGQGLMPTLLSLDTDGRVIRLDTFSKTLAPGCRTGYITANAHFCDIFQYHNEVTIQQPSGFSQALLAEMLVSHWGQEGYRRYLTENVRTEYVERSRHLQRCFHQYVNAKHASFNAPSAGMFLWIKIHVEQHPRYGTVSDSALMLEIFNKCVAHNVLLVPGWEFSSKPKPPGVDLSDLQNIWTDDAATYLRATYAYASFEDMESAMKRYGKALEEFFAV